MPSSEASVGGPLRKDAHAVNMARLAWAYLAARPLLTALHVLHDRGSVSA